MQLKRFSNGLHGWRSYALVIVGVFFLSNIVLESRGGIGRSWQEFYDPAVFMACSGTFGVPQGAFSERGRSGKVEEPIHPSLVPEPQWHKDISDFLERKSDAFSCDRIDQTLEVLPFGEGTGNFQSWMHRGSILHLLLVGLVWKIFGVTWGALTPIAAGYLAVSAGLLFAILRVFLKPIPALGLLVLLGFVSQPPLVDLVMRLRDFLKVPPILAGILLVLLITKTNRQSPLKLYFLTLGIAMGIGVNLRADLLLVGSLFIAIAVMSLLIRPELRKISNVLICASFALFPFFISYVIGNLAYPNPSSFLLHFPHLGLADIRFLDSHVVVSALSIAPVFIDQEVYRQAQMAATFNGFSGPLPYMTTQYGNFIWPPVLDAIVTVPYSIMLRIPGALYQSLTIPAEVFHTFGIGGFLRPLFAACGLYSLINFVAQKCRTWVFNNLHRCVAISAVASIQYHWRHTVQYEALVSSLSLVGLGLLAGSFFKRFLVRWNWQHIGNGIFAPVKPSSNSFALKLIATGIVIYAILLVGAAYWQNRQISLIRDKLVNSSSSPMSYDVKKGSSNQLDLTPTKSFTYPTLVRLDFDLKDAV